MTRSIGYVRELRAPGDADAAIDFLRRSGVDLVFVDLIETGRRSRRNLDVCLARLEPGDTLVVPTAVMLSPSVDHFVSTVARLGSRGASLRCLREPQLSTEAGSTTTLGAVVEAFEALRRELRSLRGEHSSDATQFTVRRPGRPRVMTEERLAIARELRAHGRSFAQIGRALGVSEAAVRRALSVVSSAGTDSIEDPEPASVP